MAANLRKKLVFYATVLGRNLVRGALPYKAHLLVTWACQARCVMCDIWRRKPVNELTLDEWTRFFRANPFLKWLTLSGGEPFLRNDLVEIAEAAAQHCPNLYCINTPTNALAADKILKAVERLSALDLPGYVLSVSLDGPPEVHNSVRGIPTAWEKAMTVLRGAKDLQRSRSAGFKVVIEHTLLPEAYGRFAELVAAVRKSVPEITARDFFVAAASTSEHYYGNAAGVQAIQDPANRPAMQRAVQDIIDARKSHRALDVRYLLPQLYLDMALPYVVSRVPPMRCRATRSTIFIDPSGIVYPCNAWNRVLGRLRESDFSLRKILSAPGMKQMRRDIDAFKCGGCWTPCEASVSLAETAVHPGTLARLAGSLLALPRRS